jgi:hypothetical protein
MNAATTARKSKVASATLWCSPSRPTPLRAIINSPTYQVSHNSSGNFAMFVAIRRISSRVSSFAAMSALPPKADIAKHCWDVRFVPNADIMQRSNPLGLLDVYCRIFATGGEGCKVLGSYHVPPGTVMASALATLLSICCIAMSIWLLLIAKNWSLSLRATYRCWFTQKNEFIADHCIWRHRTCFELWIFYSSRTLNVSAHSSDWNDGWISSGPTCWWARKTAS